MDFCQKCGCELAAQDAFCPKCGAPVVKEEPAPVVEEASDAYEAVQVPVPVAQPAQGEPSLSTKVTAIFAYFGVAGLLLAVLMGDKKGAAFHLNQALVLNVVMIVSALVNIIPVLGWIVYGIASIFFLVCWFMGLYHAWTLQEKPLPLIGKYKLYQ